MAESIHFDETSGSYADHIALYDKRIEEVQNELNAALGDGNDAQITAITERLELAKEEKRKFEQENRHLAE